MLTTVQNKTVDILYTGTPVDYFFFPGDPEYIYYGDFNVENKSDHTVEIEFDKCELLRDNQPETMNDFFVHAGNDLVGRKIFINGHSMIRIKITFPFIAVKEFAFQSIGVRSYIHYQGNQTSATSNIHLFYERLSKT